MLWKEKERSRIRDSLRVLLGIRRINRVPNARIMELCGVTKGLTKVLSSGSAVWRKWKIIQGNNKNLFGMFPELHESYLTNFG